MSLLHFSNNNEKLSKNSPEFYRFWQIRKFFEMLNKALKKIYEAVEHFSLDEVIIKFEVRFAFRQYIATKRQQWGLHLFKIADKTGYIYNMWLYLDKEKNEYLYKGLKFEYFFPYFFPDGLNIKQINSYLNNFAARCNRKLFF